MYRLIHLFIFAIAFSSSYSQNQNSSKSIENALERAQEENKQVFVNFFSSNCKISKNVKKQMKQNVFIDAFSTDYIVVNVKVPKSETSEYVNCPNPMKSFSGSSDCKKIKFPFWYIMDSAGNFTDDSFKDQENYIGYPTTKQEVNIFLEVIKSYSNKIKNSFTKVASN